MVSMQSKQNRPYPIYLIYMLKEDLTLDNQQGFYMS